MGLLFVLVSSLVLSCLADSPFPDPYLANTTVLLAFSAYCGDSVSNFTCYWCKQVQRSFSVVGTFGNPKNVNFGFGLVKKRLFSVHAS